MENSFQKSVYFLIALSLFPSAVRADMDDAQGRTYGFGSDCGWVIQQKQKIIAEAQRACEGGERRSGDVSSLLASERPFSPERPNLRPDPREGPSVISEPKGRFAVRDGKIVRLPYSPVSNLPGNSAGTDHRAGYVGTNGSSVSTGTQGVQNAACTRAEILQRQLDDFQMVCGQ